MRLRWEPYAGSAFAKSPDELHYTLSREHVGAS
jgi:hypothetical protein